MTATPATADTPSAISIELGSDPASGCPCCDPDAAQPQGFVTRDGEALALYFSDGALAGPVSGAEVTISLGLWHKASSGKDRRTASFRLQQADGALTIITLDANLSRWNILAMLGCMMSVEQVLADPEIATFRQIAERIAREDPRVVEALAQPAASNMKLSLGGERKQQGFSASKG